MGYVVISNTQNMLMPAFKIKTTGTRTVSLDYLEISYV